MFVGDMAPMNISPFLADEFSSVFGRRILLILL
jgi:hypothetical protein